MTLEAGDYHSIILQDGGYIPSRGGYQVAHNLRKHGYRIKVISFLYWLKTEDLKALAEKYATPGKDLVIGISTTFLQTQQSKEKTKYFIECLRSICRSIVVMKGGTYYYDGIDSDYQIMGQYTEDRIVKAFNHLYGKIILRPFQIETLDFKHNDDDIFPYGSSLPIEVSRHCVFKCSFCSYPNRGQKGIDRDFGLFREEILDSHHRYGTEHFMLLCSTFNDRKDKLRKFLDSVKDLPFKPSFGMFARIDLLVKQKEFWPELREVTNGILFGLESFNQQSLKSIGKAPHPDKLKDWLLEIKEYFNNSVIYSGFIIGLPFDTENDHREAQIWIEKNNALDGYDFRPLYVASPEAPADELSDFDISIEKYGYVKHENLKDHYYKKWSRPDGFTFDKATQLAYELNSKRTSTVYVIYNTWLKQFGIDLKKISNEDKSKFFKYGYDTSLPMQSAITIELERRMTEYIKEYVRLELE